MGRRRLLVGLLALGGGALVGGDPREVEALTALRAKIQWDAEGYPRFPSLRAAEDATAFAFWREGLLSRQSNPVSSWEQVLTSSDFVDTVTFESSLDLPRAIIRVTQPTFGAARSVHVKVSVFGLPAATELRLGPSGGEPAIKGGTTNELTIVSRVPVESQVKPLRGLTPRVFTSMIQVLEPVGTSGQAWRTLNKPMIVRTELQLNAWARTNGRPTPTSG